jgi:LmbE family N-acetylglucosaminyl deacetylase
VLFHHKRGQGKLPDAFKMSALLIWSLVAATLIFIVAGHYYAVDARYLGLLPFTIFIALATFLRQRNWRPELIAGAGLVLFISILLGLFGANRLYGADQAALRNINHRNNLVAEAVRAHRSQLLVGDYWRVLPAKLSAGNQINVVPLSGCTVQRQDLTAQAGKTDLNNRGFAYLLSLNKPLTDYPQCNLRQVVAAYGRPNASTVIAGKVNKPSELLLFYDHGANKSAPSTPPRQQGPATVVPISLDELPYTSCQGPTIMNIVAHQDDDLLFLSPDLIHDVRAGHCVRTIYVTAGDAGGSSFYWLGREQGSQAAYASMLGSNDLWIERIVQLGDHQFATVAKPRNNPRIALIFLRLPDGNIKGQGFNATHDESLARLESHKISAMHSVDDQSEYDSDRLVSALADFMHAFQPAEIRTLSNFAGRNYPDHSDHMAVGRYVRKAYAQYESQQFENKVTIPIKYYVGYPIHQLPENVVGTDLAAKQTVFFTYGLFDGGVCHGPGLCNHSVYDVYLRRQYQNLY